MKISLEEATQWLKSITEASFTNTTFLWCSGFVLKDEKRWPRGFNLRMKWVNTYKGLSTVPGTERPPSSRVAVISGSPRRRRAAKVQAVLCKPRQPPQTKAASAPRLLRLESAVMPHSSGGGAWCRSLSSVAGETGRCVVSLLFLASLCPGRRGFQRGSGQGGLATWPIRCSDPPADSLRESEPLPPLMHWNCTPAGAWGATWTSHMLGSHSCCLLCSRLWRPKRGDGDEDSSNREELVKIPPTLQRQVRAPGHVGVWSLQGHRAFFLHLSFLGGTSQGHSPWVLGHPMGEFSKPSPSFRSGPPQMRSAIIQPRRADWWVQKKKPQKLNLPWNITPHNWVSVYVVWRQ